MKFIIFKIGFSTYYNGIEDKELNVYDKFYQEKKSNNPEIYNFQDYNGFCYGYAPLKDGVVNLSNISFKNDTSLLFDDALILWVYEKDSKYYLVGWYKNAKVYKYLQRELSYPSVGRDLYYNTKAKSKDCFLLPVDNRNLCLDIPFENENNFYISDENDAIYNVVYNYIQNYKGDFANTTIDSILKLELENAPDSPISLYKRASIYLYNENNFKEAIRYLNSALSFKDKLSEKELVDVYYLKAVALQFLNAFDDALIYFEKVISSIDYDLNILRNMVYLYSYTKKFDMGIKTCDKILDTEKRDENSKTFLDEILGLKIDLLIQKQDYKNAKNFIEEILKDCSNENLKLHFKALLNAIEKE